MHTYSMANGQRLSGEPHFQQIAGVFLSSMFSDLLASQRHTPLCTCCFWKPISNANAKVYNHILAAKSLSGSKVTD